MTNRRLSYQSKLGFFCIATNEYLCFLENQIRAIADEIRELDWRYVVATNRTEHLRIFLEETGLNDYVKIVKCPKFRFPLASMMRFKYIAELMSDFDFTCYIDCDMAIENPGKLHDAITESKQVTFVLHPGLARGYQLPISVKEKIVELYIRATRGGLGSWETRKVSAANVPRALRKHYFAGGIFFGPSASVKELSEECDSWMDTDLKKGVIAVVHDESYINKWATCNPHDILGPEYCYTEYEWLPKMSVVVRALDKKQISIDCADD